MMSDLETPSISISQSDVGGLDRSHIDSHGEIQLPSQPSKSPGNDSGFSEPDDENNNGVEDPLLPLSKRKRFSLKTKKVFRLGAESTSNSNIVATAPILANAPDTVSDARLVSEPPKQEDHKLKDLVHNPVDTVTSKLTGQGGQQIAANLVAKEISHGQEVKLVLAQDEVLKATTETARQEAVENLDVLIKRRQDVFTRWTMDRHVTKTIRYIAEKYGGEYIGETSDPPAPSKEVLIPSIERLLVASAPIQELIMTARHIYRWENRNETVAYLGVYSALWIVDLILPGLLLSLIYLLIHRKVAAPTIEDLRKDIKRTEDLTETALTLSEFIEKKGDKAWINPLIEELGPWTLVQLSDAANMMEILRNFYEWRVPSRTGATTALLAVFLVVVTLTPVWIIVRATTLILGIMFFGLFPIASHFPDYRLLVSPLKWVFWKIPTHAAWSIKALQAEGARHKAGITSSANLPQADSSPAKKIPDPLGFRGHPTTAPPISTYGKPLPPTPEPSSSSSLSLPDVYGSYDCKYASQAGKLILTESGIRFESSVGHAVHFSLLYPEICRLEKVTRHVQKVVGTSSGEDLLIKGPDDKKYVLSRLKDRDQAFSQIVGFSPVTWQVVW